MRDLTDVLTEWRNLEHAVRTDPHHSRDHEYAVWLVHRAPAIRNLVEAQARYIAAMEDETACTAPDRPCEYCDASRGIDAAVKRLVEGI